MLFSFLLEATLNFTLKERRDKIYLRFLYWGFSPQFNNPTNFLFGNIFCLDPFRSWLPFLSRLEVPARSKSQVPCLTPLGISAYSRIRLLQRGSIKASSPIFRSTLIIPYICPELKSTPLSLFFIWWCIIPLEHLIMKCIILIKEYKIPLSDSTYQSTLS